MDQSIKKYRLQPEKKTLARRVNYEAELNPQQLEVVVNGDGPVLVIAGAGSGKTRTITYRVSWLLESGSHPSEILLLTFTNKAAREMLHRVALITQLDIRQLWGGTFHHVGNLILRPNAKRLGLNANFSILDQGDSRDLITACVSEMHGEKKDKQFPSADILQDMISFSVNTTNELQAVMNLRYPHLQDFVPAVYAVAQRYAEKKKEMNAVDYDDLLLGCKYLLENHEEVRRYYTTRFKYLLVDEYQDTNKLQADFVDLLAGESRNVMVVGDDGQSIYSFRGANFANIMEFPKRYPAARIYRLELNYRSTPEILNLANDVIRHNEYQYPKVLSAARSSLQSKPAVVPLRDSRQQADFVVQRILELNDEGVPFNEMAVLYRAHFHSMELQLELTRRGIPFLITSGVRFFEQRHIKDVVAYLKVLLNPHDELSWRRILMLIPGIGGKTAEKIWMTIRQEADPISRLKQWVDQVPRNSRAGWNEFASFMEDLSHEGFQQAPSAAIEHVFKNGYERYLEAKFPDFATRREDIHQMSSFAMQFDSLQRFLTELSLLGQIEAEDASGDTSQDRIRLSTIHQAKGLEWQVVFVIYMVDGRFPSFHSLKTARISKKNGGCSTSPPPAPKTSCIWPMSFFPRAMRRDPSFIAPPCFLKN